MEKNKWEYCGIDIPDRHHKPHDSIEALFNMEYEYVQYDSDEVSHQEAIEICSYHIKAWMDRLEKVIADRDRDENGN